jgi:hypothetical protein
MSYDEVDSFLRKWADENGIFLLQEETVPHRRFFYVSSLDNDTFQVVIEPPEGDKLTISLHLIENLLNHESCSIYTASIGNFTRRLTEIMATIEKWFCSKGTKIAPH